MDFENNKKSSNIRFPFGKRLFIGIIKFYSTEKGFGYVVSNNLGFLSITIMKRKLPVVMDAVGIGRIMKSTRIVC